MGAGAGAAGWATRSSATWAEGALGGVGPGPGLGLILGPPAGGAVLGDIGQKGKQGEAVRQAGRLIDRHGGQQLLQPLGRMRGRGAVIGDRGLAHRLDMVEQGLAALVADDVAQNAAQQSDFVAQGVVGGGAHHLHILVAWREASMWRG